MEQIDIMPRSNQRKLKYIFCGFMALLFVYGLCLPETWREGFGVFAKPIAFAAEHVPAIHKVVIFGNTARPELGYGFLGLAAYVPLIYALCFAWYGFFDRSDPKNVRLIIGIRGIRRVGGKIKQSDKETVAVFYSGSRLRFMYFNSHDEVGVKDKIILASVSLFLIVGTYILPFVPFDNKVNTHIENPGSFGGFFGDPTIDYIIWIFLGTLWAGNISGVIVDLMALLVDTVVSNKK